jgi:hypothetical protein
MGLVRLALIALLALPIPATQAAQGPDIVVEGGVKRSEIERILAADNVDTSRLSEREVADSIARVERGRAPQDFWLAYRAHVLAWKRLADAVEKAGEDRSGAAMANAEQAIEATFDEVERIARTYGARLPTPRWAIPPTVWQRRRARSPSPAKAGEDLNATASPAPHEGHDLVIVAVLDPDLAEGRARHDLEVALDRHASRLQAELEREIGDADALGHPPGLAVDRDRRSLVHLCAPLVVAL